MYVDKLILITKRYIYVSRCTSKTLNINGLKAYIKKIYESEKEIALSNRKLNVHNNIWQEIGLVIENNLYK